MWVCFGNSSFHTKIVSPSDTSTLLWVNYKVVWIKSFTCPLRSPNVVSSAAVVRSIAHICIKIVNFDFKIQILLINFHSEHIMQTWPLWKSSLLSQWNNCFDLVSYYIIKHLRNKWALCSVRFAIFYDSDL